MALRKAAGNMFDFITHIWNPVKGRCGYACSYCYVTRMFEKFKYKVPDKPYLNEKEFVNLGKDKFIFICDSLDLFHPDIKPEYISRIMEHMKLYPENKYLFLTKNPRGYNNFLFSPDFDNVFLGATVESDLFHTKGTPAPSLRLGEIKRIKYLYNNVKTLISIEPIMDFNSDSFFSYLKLSNADFIIIGADSGNNNLNEPIKEKLCKLISDLELYTKSEIILKSNLKRLLNGNK